jgi:small-conductance mechanosensitive channel
MDQVSTAVLGNFSLTLPAPNGAQLSVSGYVYADESLESLNERMDTMREALIRQQAILERPVLEEKLDMLVRTEQQIERAYLELLELKKRKTLPSQQEQNLKNYPVQLKQIREEIAKANAKLGVPAIEPEPQKAA